MRILKRQINQETGTGFVHLIPDDEEDFYYLYRILLPDDEIQSTTFRKIKIESKTGSVKTEKKQIKVTLKIKSVDYYPGENTTVEIKGINIQENNYLNLGQAHTLKLELHNAISIVKHKWEKYHIDQLKECSDITNTAEVAAYVMDEGVAHLCYIKNNSTRIKAKIEKNIPKKKSGSKEHSKALENFFQDCFDQLKDMNMDQLKCFILASPGFVKDEFHNYIKLRVQNGDQAKLKTNMDKFLLVHTSSGYVNSLEEVFKDEAVKVTLENTKSMQEMKLLEEFYEIMKENQDKVAYGPKQVMEAVEKAAVNKLLISDKLFRSKNFQQRKVYSDCVEKVKELNGDVCIFSSFHTSGEKLNGLTGIAAILRFPLNLDYLDDEEDQDQQEDDENQQNLNEEEKEEESDDEEEKKQEDKKNENIYELLNQDINIKDIKQQSNKDNNNDDSEFI